MICTRTVFHVLIYMNSEENPMLALAFEEHLETNETRRVCF